VGERMQSGWRVGSSVCKKIIRVGGKDGRDILKDAKYALSWL
jgi:hypothetical protein